MVVRSTDVCFGWAGFDPSSRVPLVYRGEGSIFSGGKPGSAKTLGLVIPNLIEYDASVIIHDPKNEIVERTALWRSAVLKHQVHIFDPYRAANPKYLPRVNGQIPYASVDLIKSIRRAKAPSILAKKYADTMISTEQTNEAHFPKGARALHTALDLFVAFDPLFDEEPEDRTKETAWGIFSDPDMLAISLLKMQDSKNLYVKNQANAFLDVSKDDREMRGIKSSLRTDCSLIYSDPALMATLCHESVDFSTINDVPTTVYLVLPLDISEPLYQYMRLIMTYLIAEIQRGGLRRFHHE